MHLLILTGLLVFTGTLSVPISPKFENVQQDPDEIEVVPLEIETKFYNSASNTLISNEVKKYDAVLLEITLSVNPSESSKVARRKNRASDGCSDCHKAYGRSRNVSPLSFTTPRLDPLSYATPFSMQQP